MSPRIAWSRSGLLAYIDQAHAVWITWLRCVDGEKWEYVSPVPVQVAAESKPVSLSWSSTNYDLAIADDLGRVQIVSISSAGVPTNQILSSTVRDSRSRPAELDRLVGMQWLGSEKNLITPQPASEGSPMAKSWSSVAPLGPFHPVKSRGALACVNGNGMFRLLVQMPDYRYSEVDALIPGATFVSRASFTQNGPESLLVTLVNGDNTLVVYEALIKWDKAKMEEKKAFASVVVHPVAYIQLEPGKVLSLATFRYSGAKEVMIRAVYASKTLNFQLIAMDEMLHSSFFEFFGTSEPVQPDSHRVWKLDTLDEFQHKEPVSKLVILRLALVTVYESGSISTESLVPDVSAGRFDQVGLVYDPEKLRNSTSLCFSPTGLCVAAFTSESAEIPDLIAAQPKLDFTSDDAKKVAATLALLYSCTVFNSEQCDDVLKVCWSSLHSSEVSTHTSVFFNTLASEAQRLLNVNLVAPEDQRMVDRLVVIPSPPQRWLSFLIALGTSKGWKRTPGCHMALSVLNLQLLAFGLTWTLKKVSVRSQAQTVNHLRMEIQAGQFHINNMLGPVRWATDLIARICRELYLASVAPEPPADAKYKDSPAGHVLLGTPNVYSSLLVSSVARYLIRYILRGIRSLTAISKNLADQEGRLNTKVASVARSGDSPAAEVRSRLASPANFSAALTFKKLLAQLQAAPIPFDSFEKLILDLDEKVKVLATTAQLQDNVKQALDAELIKYAKAPHFFMPLVNPIIESFRKLILPPLNVPDLYFYDTAWLGLDDVNSSWIIDGLRKRVILPQEPLQVCTRCGTLSVASDPGKPPAPQWLFMFQRHCVCGGSWLRITR